MSCDVMTNDLSPRTWRRWWRELPGYWRIVCWFAIGCVLSNLLLCGKLFLSEIEPADIHQLRAAGRVHKVEYAWNLKAIRDHRIRTYLRRLLWHSRFDVELLVLKPNTADDEVKHVVDRFPNLKSLGFQESEISAAGLQHLTRLKRISKLSFYECRVDDEMVRQLAGINTLTELHLPGTLVTDAIGDTLLGMPNLARIDVRYTAVKTETVDEWLSMPRPGQPKLIVLYEKNEFVKNGPLDTVFRWSDGRISPCFPGYGICTISGPLDSDDYRVRTSNCYLGYILKHDLRTFVAGEVYQHDGMYRVTVKIGDHESEPVDVLFEKESRLIHTAEFRMPVTKAEALRGVAE